MLRILTIFLTTTILLFPKILSSQKAQDEKPFKPIKIELNDDGSTYIRLIFWNQLWVNTNNLDGDDNLSLTTSVRRSRLLAFAEINSRVMIVTHFGLNSLSPENMTALGNDGNGPQVFLHGGWGQVKLLDELYLGAGLHYWKGLTRLNTASTLNFMTLDQPRPFTHWNSLGITDQFARTMGIYAKGQIENFDYRLSVNNPHKSPLGDGADYGTAGSGLVYAGNLFADEDGNSTGNMIYEGYFRYNFFDKESTTLPYNVGTYLGKKKVLAIGAGFFLHPDGMYEPSTAEHSGVTHFAGDIYADMPIDDIRSFNAYASFTKFDYGENYVSRWGGTGTSIYVQAGFHCGALNLMPYVAFQHNDFEGFEDPVQSLDAGINYFIFGHNAKATLEYHMIMGDIRESAIITQEDALSQIRLQLHLFI
jgi:hypothetical protein